MESEECKLFIGGITWDTTEDKLRDYFSKYGDVTHAVVMREKVTGRPRGFGFVIFNDPNVLLSVLRDTHTIDGRMVEVKRALSKDEQNAFRQDHSNTGKGSGVPGNLRTKKIFVGGLPPTLTEEGFRQYFENYGNVTDAVIMYDQNTQRPRGFGFITFSSEDAVDMVLHKTFHDINGKDVEVKRALPKEANPGGSNRGGGYQNYGSSRSNSGSYDNQMDRNRFMQPQGGAGFSQYSGYNATAGYGGYGGPGGSYGGYGSFGMGGYGGAAGFAGPGVGYGGSNAANAGYGGGPNAMKTAWNNQTSGYGAGAGYGGAGAGYGAGAGAGYGGGAGYGPSSAGGSVQPGQSFGGGHGYGNQAYGGYGSGGYGASGGRGGSGPASNTDGGEQTVSGGGYMGGGYGDGNRNAGYGGSGWRSDPSEAAGGFGDAQSWRGQQ